MSEPTTYDRLAERFPVEAHKKKPQGNRELTYVTGEMVVARLNAVLGFDGWSFEVKDIKVLDNEVWASGRLTIYSRERTIVREQTGGQIINRNRQGDIVELSNDIKGAVTDCLKKTATLIGVAAYLYDEDERREVEAEMRGAKRPTPFVANAQPAATAAGTAATTPPAAGVSTSSRSTTATVAADQRVESAAVLTGANPKPTGDLSEEQRAKAEAEYTRLAAVAVERKHKDAAKIQAKKAEDLTDALLIGSIAVLQKWESSLPLAVGAA